MKEIFNYVVGRYGVKVELVGEETSRTVTAFLQPVTSRDKRYYKDRVANAGIVPGMRYLYLGPADSGLEDTDVICGGSTYAAVSTETIMAGGQALCCWAILRRVA